jgi:hypothetical protein
VPGLGAGALDKIFKKYEDARVEGTEATMATLHAAIEAFMEKANQK